MAMLNRGFWENVRARRINQGLTCEQVGEELGVSGDHYYRMESRGSLSMDDEKLEKLMLYLGTTVENMITDTGKYVYTQFWGNLNTIAKRKKITMQTIADRLGVSRNCFYAYRNTYADSVPLKLAQEIAAAIDEPLINLMGLREQATEGYTAEELLFIASAEGKAIIREAMAKQRVG